MGQSIDLPQLPTRRLRVHRADKSGSCHPSAGEPDAAPAVRSPRAPAGTRSTAAADQSRSRNRGLLANPVAGADADISDRADPGYRTPPRSRRHPHRPVRTASMANGAVKALVRAGCCCHRPPSSAARSPYGHWSPAQRYRRAGDHWPSGAPRDKKFWLRNRRARESAGRVSGRRMPSHHRSVDFTTHHYQIAFPHAMLLVWVHG